MDSDGNNLAISPRAFAQAYARGFPSTVQFLVGKGAPFELAEELAQRAWAHGWEALAELRCPDRTQVWVNRIAYLNFYNHRRFCNHRRRLASVEPPVGETPDHGAAVLLAGVDARLLLVKACKPKERQLLVQRYIAGMTFAEIAAAQGASEIAVRVRIHRCCHRLRDLAARPKH